MGLLKRLALCGIFLIGFPITQVTAGTNGNLLEPLPRDLEVRLALSALPPYLRAEASVYVLDPAKGYALERQGMNGFTCFVERTDFLREDYRNDSSHRRVATPVMTVVPLMSASPSLGAISYMLSPIQRLYGGPESKATKTMNMPHYMFYAPNLTRKDVGGGPIMGPYPYLVNAGPHAYIIVNVGEAEKAQINREERDLRKEVCSYRSDFCIDKGSGKAPGQ